MKRVFLLIIPLLFITGCKEKVLRVGVLIGVEENIPVAEAFKEEMKSLGYIEGENITYDIQVGKSDSELMTSICKTFVDDEVDLIYTITHGATVSAKIQTEGSDIPVVFSYAVTNRGDLVESIAKPGGNVTGVRYPIPDMAIKRFEFLLEIDPEIKSVLLPHKKEYPPAMIVINGLKLQADSEGVELIDLPLNSLDHMEESFKSLEQLDIKPDSIIVLPEPFVYSDRGWDIINSYAYRTGIPIAANSFHMSRNGALFSYTNIDEEMGELAAPLADKVLKGGNPGEIPIVTPKIYMHINLAVAKRLGLEIPDKMMKLAIEIVKDE